MTGSDEGPRRDYFRFVLSDVLGVRYDVSGSLADLDDAEDLLRHCLASPVMPVQLSRRHFERMLGSVLRRRFSRTGEKADIDDAIALMSKDADNPARLTNLGNALLDRFRLFGDVNDLEAAVNAQVASVDATPAGDWQLASRYNNAGNALSAAADYTGDDALARQAVESFRQVSGSQAQRLPNGPLVSTTLHACWRRHAMRSDRGRSSRRPRTPTRKPSCMGFTGLWSGPSPPRRHGAAGPRAGGLGRGRRGVRLRPRRHRPAVPDPAPAGRQADLAGGRPGPGRPGRLRPGPDRRPGGGVPRPRARPGPPP